MSVRCERPNSEGMQRTSFRTATTNNSFVVYVYLHSRPSSGNYDVIASFYAPGSFSGGAVYVDENGALRWRDDNGDLISAAGSGTIALDTWTKVVIVLSSWTGSGTVNVYLAGSTSPGLSVSCSVSGTIDLEIGHGNSSYTTARFSDASFFNPKYREAAWTASEGSTELDQAAFAVAGLARWLLDDHTDLDDDEGALDLSAVGTLSTGPDDPWGDTPANSKARIAGFEFELPDVPRRVRIAGFEFEVPNAPRRVRIAGFEFEVPNAPRRARIAGFELEVPDLPTNRKVRVVAFELEAPDAPRRVRISSFEMQLPDVGGQVNQSRITIRVGLGW